MFSNHARAVERLRTVYQTDDSTSSSARIELERKYQSILQPTDDFNRQLVSYQANKTARMHRWFKYKEGFSAQLVNNLIKQFNLISPQHILDPFAGVSTMQLVAREFGLNATGIELMPIGDIVWNAKSRQDKCELPEVKSIREWVKSTPPGKSKRAFPHVPITYYAFSAENEAQLMWYDEQFANMDINGELKALLKFVLLSILEDVSFTSKDGQFLRWDSRSEKVKERNLRRIAEGKKPFKLFHKNEIMNVKSAILNALDLIISDISMAGTATKTSGEQRLIQGSVLETLPRYPANQFDAVITSPPYCNRYDYTRTYALELAFLGVTSAEFLALRQELLSCTVENRPKVQRLRKLYEDIGRPQDFERVWQVLSTNMAFQETLEALRIRNRRREVNNKGILSMVEGYFTELAFVTFELFRVCKTGAQVAIVNDNVRYSGEIVPVDLIMSDIAASFGFTTEKILVLAQRKGNSSQQMGKYGREALRKSILIWKK